MPKLDLIVIPSFSAGGMENGGLVILSESRVFNPLKAGDLDHFDSLDIVMLVAHEVAHQWFGNLVSIGSYAELWLKEGFATYFESLAATAFHPDCYTWDRFYTEVTMGALSSDSPAVRPLSFQTPITSLSQYDSLFDQISYDKGAAIVRMIRMAVELVGGPAKAISVMGSDGNSHLPLLKRNKILSPPVPQPNIDVFMQAIGSFLTKYAEKAVSSTDLYASLKETTGLDIPFWMTNWTVKPGYPVVTSSIHKVDGKHILHLSQRPLSGSCNDDTGEGRWWVPVLYKLQGGTGMNQAPSFTELDTCNKNISLDSAQAHSYALVNIGRTAYYRSSYNSESWQSLLVDASNPALIPPADLAGLLDDSWQLSYLGLLDSWAQSGSIFLMICQGLEHRGILEYEPWRVALDKLERSQALMATAAVTPSLVGIEYNATSCHNTLSLHIREKVTALISTWGLNFTVGHDESIDVRLLRPLVLLAAGVLKPNGFA